MIYRYILSLTLLFSLFTLSLPQVGYAQTATAQAIVSEQYAKQLAAIEEKAEKRRAELGIPGMSLIIVKDGKVIYSKGVGYKDFEKKIPITPDTQFAIGSATKAFTALSLLMSVDEGKVNLDASPRTYLPYFKMKDPETDKSMTVRDLMDHSSGLNRTDLAMITGKLNRVELIKVAGEAQPMAKLNEKFFYNNIMFAAAGEVVATVQKTPWEKIVPAKIFAPLGMSNSTMSIKEMEKAKDYSFGYEYNFDTKETRRLPFRPIDDVAPAGSINSSANDMAKWITFVMDGGTINGKKMISDKSFEEWTKPQNKVTPNGKVNYGLGWFLQDWNGLKVVQHGGNIDGFNSLVAMIPEKKLGFVMLTNVTGSPLGGELMPIVWENILGKPDAPKTDNLTGDLAKEVGTYRFEQAGYDVEIELKDGKLMAKVPNQPAVTLENIEGRKYKVKEAASFFVTFKDDSLLFENPQGSFVFPKKSVANDSSKEVGKYKFEAAGFDIEVKMQDGKLVAIVPGQPVYELQNVGGRKYKLANAPDGFFVTFKDDSAYLEQPQGNFTLPKEGAKTAEAKTSNEAAKELVGSYLSGSGRPVEIKNETDGSVTFNINNQPPYALSEKSKDIFSMTSSSATLTLRVKRNADGKIDSIVAVRPDGEFEFKRKSETISAETPKITVDELMAKTIEAAGGESNWRKITSRVTVAEIDAVHQGVKGTTTSWAKAPNKNATETTLTAVGKTIAKGWEYFDGTNGEEIYTFALVEKYEGKKLEDIRLGSDFYAPLNWKKNYKTIEIKGTEKVGDEECYAVEFTPEKGTKFTEYYSTKSFLMLKRKGVSASSTSEQTQPYTIVFSDYREVDGVKLPFKSVNTTGGMGDIISIVKSYKHNVKIDDKVFATKKLK